MTKRQSKILDMLKGRPGKAYTAGRIAINVNRPASGVRKDLVELYHENWVTRVKLGSQFWYKAGLGPGGI